MLADPWALASDPLLIEHRLHALERLRVDQRFMASIKGLLVLGASPVDDLADVVAIAQQALHDGRSERLGHSFGGRPGAQTETFQLSGKLRDGVFARRVQLERDRDERPTLGVHDDDGDPPTVRQFIDAVEVAERCRAVSAADAGLLTQPALDTLAGLHRLELVLSGDHALVQKCGGGVITDHRLGDGDELGSRLTHQLPCLPVVALVARPPRQATDDHVVHMG
ncbi:MAG TPA: hypothetical protein VK655_03115 [Solirubrobacteraceae bacterium]|nr:hypothetical protein [Solirubrobacteraceae bacterium]